MTDVLFVHSNASVEIYQDLAKDYSAIEPPIWAGLLANHVRTRGFKPEILDCEAMAYDDATAVHHIKTIAPRLIVMVVYGQQPSASAQNMEGAVRLTKAIKNVCNIPIMFVGIYPSALPEQTLEAHPEIDFVATGEGVYTISDLLKFNLQNWEKYPQTESSSVRTVQGLGYRTREQYKGDTPDIEGVVDCIHINPPAKNVAQEDLVHDLPGMAWDLLPMSRYRTALWHALPNGANRQPFASLYTSLGCPFSCTFCCINQPFGGSSFRYWPPEFIVSELEKIAKMGIINVKFADEMWLLRADHFMRTCELIIEKGLKLNIWVYARVDTIKNHDLSIVKKAGVNWFALGIESANTRVRKDVYKGRFTDTDIPMIVNKIRDAGINVIGNYIFGLPEDDLVSMEETLNLAIEMNTEEANFYCAMAYPGSALHKQAIKEGWELPYTYSGFSQHSYNCKPLNTKYITAKEVLNFRDKAWMTYHTNSKFLEMIRNKFGQKAYEDTVASTKIVLKRKLLENEVQKVCS